MIEHLRHLYKHTMITDPSKADSPDDYVWFQTEDGPVGFLKSALSNEEKSLLGVFLTPYVSDQNLSPKHAFWHALLFSGAKSGAGNEPETPFRLIHFYVKDPSIDNASFSEAVNGLIPSETVILWETEQEGVIVRQMEAPREELVHYEDLVDAVAGDFYTDLYLYVGMQQNKHVGSNKIYNLEKMGFATCLRQLPTKSVYYHDEQIPFLLLQKTRSAARSELIGDLLKDISWDKELMNSIYEYLACGMNVTTASKKLYIHRNSLQYRIDKFIEKTGFDIRSFPQAVTVYLALLEKHL
jgi:hypothetical protein